MATKKTTESTSLANITAELAKRAKAAVATTGAPTGAAITTSGGIMQYQGSPVPNNKMEIVIINHAFENAFYLEKYDPKNIQSPDCYARGFVEAEMKPNPLSKHKQSEDCATCPQNQWGSADTGKGKACGNRRYLALIPVSDLKDISAAPVATIKTPPTSNKVFDKFVRDVAELDLPPLGVKTELKLMPDTKDQFHMEFRVISKVEPKYLEALFTKSDGAVDILTAAYPVNTDEEPAAKSKAPAKKSKFSR
jgi:hypothetical protein